MTDELEEIRQGKAADLKQKEAEAARQQQMLQQLRKGALLFLTPEARDRLDNVGMIRPELAAQAELMIVKLVQSNQISRESPMSDQQLTTLLRNLTSERKTTITRK